MQFEVSKTWQREVPGEWETTLREFSPISRVIPWLALRWFPCRRPIDGVWQDAGRWMLSECVPEEVIPENLRDITLYLGGQRPSSLPAAERKLRETFCNDYQWEMYRTHRVWARELWIIQGDQGGHATFYDDTEQEIRRVHGLSVDPPAVGDLPYAPFDKRVVEQMLRRNRLVRLKMSLDEMRQYNADDMRREEEEAAKAARAAFVSFVCEQSASTADLVAWYSSKSDHRDDLPQATPEQIKAAEQFQDSYIETGGIAA